MSAFSAEQISKAIDRVPATGSRELKVLLGRARTRSIAALVAAIEAELDLRGAADFDRSTAERHADWSMRAAGLDLTAAILMAFSEVPINADEHGLTLHIARNPGVGYQSLVTIRRKGDVGLILGHMVYERLGFFRNFLDGSGRISNLLFARAEEENGRVTYRLTHEAEVAFQKLGLLDATP